MTFARPEFADNLKCTLVIIDLGIRVTASYNPKEVSIEKSVPWQKHKTSKGDNPILEFTDAEPKTLAVDLFFDTYESGENVHLKHIAPLEKSTLIMGGSDEEKKRPPNCMLIWGQGFPKFVGVVESLSVKYTMFFPDGTPCRATASVKMKQASKTTKASDKDVPIDDAGGGSSGGGVSSTPGSDGTSPR